MTVSRAVFGDSALQSSVGAALLEASRRGDGARAPSPPGTSDAEFSLCDMCPRTASKHCAMFMPASGPASTAVFFLEYNWAMAGCSEEIVGLSSGLWLVQAVTSCMTAATGGALSGPGSGGGMARVGAARKLSGSSDGCRREMRLKTTQPKE
eukprot:CAMPEP_0176186152 /NCGR_PEP_ID=MMETSP0121_2-20121125/1720_1 /TAXON_ID=160619 /ORGANISM="Kryptoperidinium foliaceum, Strain CCMP 1326" /LENGTH=151 /DNA_ID=CAMNT_0017524623 /DNA_START=142 /DNA_END=598 /DNA_ORIENTATION=-